MSTAKNKKYRIVAGPGEMDLLMSLFGRGHGNSEVTFTMRSVDKNIKPSFMRKIVPPMLITALEYAGDNYDTDMWKFKGKSNWTGELWVGTYSHRTRKGHAESLGISKKD